MAQRPAATAAIATPASLRPLGETILALMGTSAALVVDGSCVIAVNARWQEVTGCRSCSAGLLTLEDSLRGFSGIEALMTSLQAGTQSFGSTPLLGPSETAVGGASRRRYVARWRQIELAAMPSTFAIIVLDASDSGQDLESIIKSQRVRINQLLVRQTLIEERERQRLGRALHDDVVQHLACIRVRLERGGLSDRLKAALVMELDEAIASTRELTFELSPPILEDLGLLPALHWLADDLSRRYDSNIELVDDGVEPRLSPSARTIVFRGIRELAINAAKHAASADITIISEARPGTSRFGIRDEGCGFDVSSTHQSVNGFRRFGLLSVEQQIHAIGGSLEIVSIRGEGTRATITVPCDGAGAAP